VIAEPCSPPEYKTFAILILIESIIVVVVKFGSVKLELCEYKSEKKKKKKKKEYRAHHVREQRTDDTQDTQDT